MDKYDTVLNGVEATKLDYKINLESEKPKSWLKSVSAFANTSVGHILFGVTNDTHEWKGLQNPQVVASKIAEFIATRISPAPRYELNELYSEASDLPCIPVSESPAPCKPPESC